MKLKLIKILVAVTIIFSQSTSVALANTAGSSAMLTSSAVPKVVDNRADILRGFLEKNNSPLAPFADSFVKEADKNKIDWKLVAAIAGNESQFGLLIPAFSNNGWGYGVYGNNVRSFASWEEGIAVVSKAIRVDYFNNWGATSVYEIGAIYAEDPMWSYKVSRYISLIENFESETSNSSISISF